ncbi:MAG TPA: DUF3883 domain-containing protein [Bacillota bacterium]|nr:DUF3883 domain-containing protein [Bacillota bacterium]
MAFGEKDLHPYVKLIVEERGRINTTDLEEKLRSTLDLSEKDLEPLRGRNDDRFSQTVRNLVSHAKANEQGIAEKHGYLIDKTKRPAVFFAKDPVNSSEGLPEKIDETEIEKRQQRQRSYVASKVDFDRINKERKLVGDAGEKFALSWERNRLKALQVSFDVFEEVLHSSKLFGDGLGYDILSRKDEKGEPLFIEVKTTKGPLSTPFYLSVNEWHFLQDYQDQAVIYRVYNFDEAKKDGKIVRLTYEDIQNNYELESRTYAVFPKK